MDSQGVHDYLLTKPLSSVGRPFGPGVDVYKVKDKMFATLALGKMGKEDKDNRHWRVNLKCDPDEAKALRDIFTAVIPGYHMNKKLWNTVMLDGSIPAGEIQRMIDNSYTLVVSNMPKKEREQILSLL